MINFIRAVSLIKQNLQETMNFIKRINNWRNASERNRIIERANERFQICEHKGVLWITFNGIRVVSEAMLQEDAITTVKKLREQYINEY